MAGAVTADEVMGHLTDVDYPADKDALLAAASSRGASEEVLRAIRAIPPVDYRNDDEVIRSLRLDPSPGREPGAQARAEAAQGVGQAVRDPQEDRVTGEDRRTV
ncbi:Protein of unknown function [Blastococcus sp. DSM 46786]|uniref:DUF2795 domain-containing protein n=1 Tax=Blastococcus sp. DSM 46786 TaxID=1798227 RepID=UPI0008D5EB5E|nr:DUF2795 domain-containing protein [Blastococcus sp. DSM 46786]SEK65024.1 Protein of unknown function [Blastococcus sp. DSM 46786]